MEGKEARVRESTDRVERVRTCRLVFARLWVRRCFCLWRDVWCSGRSCRYARVSLDPGQEGWSEVHLMLLDVCISPELQSKLGELSSPS